MGLRLGRAFRGLGRADGRTILRVLAMAIADLRRRVVRKRTRSAPRSRGAGSATRRWGRGLRARRRCSSTTRPGATAGPPARRSTRAGGPGALSDALASAARAAGGRDPDRRRGRRRHLRRRRPGDRDRPRVAARRSRPVRSSRASTRSACSRHSSIRWRSGRALRWRAAQHPDAGVGRPRSTSCSTACRHSRRRPRIPRLLRGRILVGMTGIDALERVFDPDASTAHSPISSPSRPRSRRWRTRRSWTAPPRARRS